MHSTLLSCTLSPTPLLLRTFVRRRQRNQSPTSVGLVASPLRTQLISKTRSYNRVHHSPCISERNRPPHRCPPKGVRATSRRPDFDRCERRSPAASSSPLTSNLIIGGDGPKIVELDQMRDKYQSLLRDRVTLLGAVRHENVREVRVSSDPRTLASIAH